MIYRHLKNCERIVVFPTRLLMGQSVKQDFSGYDFDPKKYGLSPYDFELDGKDNKANFAIASQNNATQIQLTHEANQFNAEQAQLNRDFNAEQAQISREWNSEQAVMERRAEAGLNTAITGQGGTGSGSGSSAQASGTPASAVTPPTLHNAHINRVPYENIVNAGVELAKAPSEIEKNKQTTKESIVNVDKLQAETDFARESAKYQKIVNEYTPDQQRALISELASRGQLNEANRTETLALAEVARYEVVQTLFDVVKNLQSADQNIQNLLSQYEYLYTDMERQAKQTLSQHVQNLLHGSYEYGESMSIGGKSSVSNRTSGSFDAQLSADMGYMFKGEATVNLNAKTIGIGAGSTGKATSQANIGLAGQLGLQMSKDYEKSSDELHSKTMKSMNEMMFNKGIRLLQNSEILKNAKYKDARIKALEDTGLIMDYFSKVKEAIQYIDTQILPPNSKLLPTQ